MRRDMEAIRAILLKIEEEVGPRGFGGQLRIDGFTDDIVDYNLGLLIDSGYVDGSTVILHSNSRIAHLKGLTMAGHDLLDALRNPEIVAEAKRRFPKILDYPLDAIKDVLVSLAAEALKRGVFGA